MQEAGASGAAGVREDSQGRGAHTSGYDQLYTEPDRGIVELPRATVELAYIGLLYRIKRKGRGLSRDER